MRIVRAAALLAILVRDEALLIEAEAAIECVVIEEQQPGGGAGIDLDIAVEAIGGVARD